MQIIETNIDVYVFLKTYLEKNSMLLIVYSRKFSNMGRRRESLPKLESIEIFDAGTEGKSVGKFNEKIVFVPYSIPGDVVDVQVVKKKSSYLEARVTAYRKYSDLRIEAKCKYFGVCGGCKWQNLDYQQQLKFKQKQVVDNLQRIGKVDTSTMNEIIGNETPYFYRNKLEFTFSNFRWLTDFNKGDDISSKDMDGLGFHVPGMFDRVVDIDECLLQPEPSNAIRNEVKRFTKENQISYFDLKRQEGMMRNLIIRTSSTGEIMVIVVFFHEDVKKRLSLLEHLKINFPEITSLMFVINMKNNDSITDQEVILYSGKDHIMEQMGDLKFKVGPKSFYQTNSKQAHELYKVALEFAGVGSDDLVYDLYTGTGTIANFVAKRAAKVVGIEYVESAIEDAKLNSEINDITNANFYAGDMVKVLNDDFVNENGKPSIIITDPPRAGMHPKVVDLLNRLKVPKIVYVSCNPATQARDLLLMSEVYDVVAIQPVDMFPQTAHVENVVLLKLKS